MKKTNAMRILDGLKIPYKTRAYDDDGEHQLQKGAAINLSEKLGIDPRSVFKTIVMSTDTKEIVVFCQNASCEISLKKARTVCGAKEVHPVKPEELLSLTGYIRGGCSPIGMKRKFRTFIDESVFQCGTVYVSAGVRGLQLALSPADLVKASGAQTADLVQQ
ncbi:Cys-tRNA(Pro) deacylase [Treponema sp.]|uniref:Cys-tRNA(Pro) deacylase n=1 Tax=Treponema sp. TaxID=166 RepID=UPI003F0DD4EC